MRNEEEKPGEKENSMKKIRVRSGIIKKRQEKE